MRYLDSRAQNYDDISRKAAENEDTLKLKYADLARRHNETLQKYSTMQAENRSLREQSNQSTPVKEKVIRLEFEKYFSLSFWCKMRVLSHILYTGVLR